MKKKPTRAEQLQLEWQAYNKRQKQTHCGTMTFEEYCKWVMGKTSKRIKACEKTPTYMYPSWASSTKNIKSLGPKGDNQACRNSMIERVRQGIITGDAATEIVRKSNRVGLLTSKGAYGYISDDTDIKTLGKKTQALDS